MVEGVDHDLENEVVDGGVVLLEGFVGFLEVVGSLLLPHLPTQLAP